MSLPEFRAGEELSAGKLNRLSRGLGSASIQPGPGLRAEQTEDGTVLQDTRYRRTMIGRTGGAAYPASSATITISTAFPFEFVDIDQDLTPVVKERGDAAFACYNLSLIHIATDTLIVVEEHRGEWYTQTGGTGSGSVSIWFTIDSVVCDEITGERYIVVTPDRVAPPCETVPGEDEYGLINVYDDGFQCILNEYTDEELLGMRGRATYASGIGGTCAGTWTLDGLCDTGEC